MTTSPRIRPDAEASARAGGWRLQRELGIEYHPAAGTHRPHLPGLPVYAERGLDNHHLVVFEVGVHDWIPQRTECCTLLVDAGSRVLLDTRDHGIRDGFGVLASESEIALLRRSTWELVFFTLDGEVVRTIDLSRYSKDMPRVLSRTGANTFLVACLTDLFNVELVEIDAEGRLLWYLAGIETPFGFPSSLQLGRDGHVLLADEFCHQAIAIDRQGRVQRRMGRTNDPGMKTGLVAGPRSVRETRDGGWLIADTRNHRLVETDRDGIACATASSPVPLCGPSFADRLPDGNTLVCDAGNDWVYEVDARGNVRWQWGEPLAVQRSLSFPRSASVTTAGTLLVADTANDRIVELNLDGGSPTLPAVEQELFWPRSARELDDGRRLLADSRQSRIVEVGPDGQLIRELKSLRDGDEVIELSDPHDVRPLPDGTILIVDSPHNLVAAADWDAEIRWRVDHACGKSFADPHSAQWLADGRVLISDTANHRVVIVDPATGDGVELSAFVDGAAQLRFHHPRFAEMTPDGVLVVVDAGNNRVLAGGEDGALRWQIDGVPESPLPGLAQPRWVELRGNDELFIVDHRQHRIVHLARDRASGPPDGS